MLMIKSNFLLLFGPKFFLPSLLVNGLIMSFFLKVHIVSLMLETSFFFHFHFYV
jgi:hypothetical protein